MLLCDVTVVNAVLSAGTIHSLFAWSLLNNLLENVYVFRCNRLITNTHTQLPYKYLHWNGDCWSCVGCSCFDRFASLLAFFFCWWCWTCTLVPFHIISWWIIQYALKWRMYYPTVPLSATLNFYSYIPKMYIYWFRSHTHVAIDKPFDCNRMIGNACWIRVVYFCLYFLVSYPFCRSLAGLKCSKCASFLVPMCIWEMYSSDAAVTNRTMFRIWRLGCRVLERSMTAPLIRLVHTRIIWKCLQYRNCCHWKTKVYMVERARRKRRFGSKVHANAIKIEWLSRTMLSKWKLSEIGRMTKVKSHQIPDTISVMGNYSFVPIRLLHSVAAWLHFSTQSACVESRKVIKQKQ